MLITFDISGVFFIFVIFITFILLLLLGNVDAVTAFGGEKAFETFRESEQVRTYIKQIQTYLNVSEQAYP